MYTGHDSANAGNSYLLSNWKCYSSIDMVNWTDHGVMLSPKSVSWSTAHDANAILFSGTGSFISIYARRLPTAFPLESRFQTVL
jgi:hypothetical protein